jgi:CHAT domain-containing protein
MDLQGTEAVVLSACSTGTGQLRGTNVSEGVASLSHAFRLAGARAVVGTLWEVEDRNTAEMMQGLFQELNKSPEQGRDWSLALQAAQIERIRALADPDSVGVAHPFFWAGVTLVGP